MKSYKKNTNYKFDCEENSSIKNDIIKNYNKRNVNYLKMNVNSLIDQAIDSGLLNSPYGLNTGGANLTLDNKN